MYRNCAREPLTGASSSRSGMKWRSLFSGSRNRNVPASNCAQSEPNAFVDMQSTSTWECSSTSSTFAGMLSPGLISHSSNQTRSLSPATALPPRARRPCLSSCGSEIRHIGIDHSFGSHLTHHHYITCVKEKSMSNLLRAIQKKMLNNWLGLYHPNLEPPEITQSDTEFFK
jgi:hypothetical protein